MKARGCIIGAFTVALALSTTACSSEARAERKGKQFGDEVCKIEGSRNENEAQRHVRRAQDKLDDLDRFVGREVRDDLTDADRNLDQLARDISKGRDLREQDVNLIVQNVHEAAAKAYGSARAAYDGMIEGLDDCA